MATATADDVVDDDGLWQRRAKVARTSDQATKGCRRGGNEDFAIENLVSHLFLLSSV